MLVGVCLRLVCLFVCLVALLFVGLVLLAVVTVAVPLDCGGLLFGVGVGAIFGWFGCCGF